MSIWWTVCYCIKHRHFGRQTQNVLEPWFFEFWVTILSQPTCLKITRIQFWAVVTQPLWKMESMGYLAAFLDRLSHSHYADMGDRCQLSCQRPHHSLHPPPPANHPLLLLKMQHTWITPQLSQLPGPNLIKQLGHLVNNQSSWKDKCGLNGVSHIAVQRAEGNGSYDMSPGKRGQLWLFLNRLTIWHRCFCIEQT